MLEQSWLMGVIQTFVAIFGALTRVLNTNSGKLKGLGNMLSELVVAGFTGLIIFFISKHLQLDSGWAYALAGISGWIGPQVLDMLTGLIAKHAGLELPQNAAKTEPASAPARETGKVVDFPVKTDDNSDVG